MRLYPIFISMVTIAFVCIVGFLFNDTVRQNVEFQKNREANLGDLEDFSSFGVQMQALRCSNESSMYWKR